MLSAVRGSRAAPSPSIATLTPSASDRTTSLWSAHARPRASSPGPRLADVAGTLTWTRTRLEPLEKPVGGERDRPGVEDDVVVGEDEHAHDDQDHARGPLHHGNERAVAPESPQKGAERRGREEEREAESCGICDQQADAASDVLGSGREGEDRAEDRPDARSPADRECDADRERAEVARRLLRADSSPVRSATDIPVMNDRYDGKSGSTHGDRNEKSPALNETATPTDSPMATSAAPRSTSETRRCPTLAAPARAR